MIDPGHEHGRKIAFDTIRFERHFDAPIGRVWDYLVDDEKRGQWFASGSMELRAGGKLQFHFDHDNLSARHVPYPSAYRDMKGHVADGHIIRIDPPHLLSLHWGKGEDVTTFELSEANGGTKLVLTHSGLVGVNDRPQYASGWHAHLAVLEDRLAGRMHPDFWATFDAARKDYAELMAGG